MKNGYTLPVIGFVILFFSTSNACNQIEKKEGEWEAPASSNNLKSRMVDNLLAEAKGLDPDQPRSLSKVTRTL